MIDGVYHFRGEDAKKYGMAEAVLLYNLRYWVEKNTVNNKNFHDGYYWTYNSVKAFTKQFPFLSSGQIERALRNLEKIGCIKSGNYNLTPYDRTKWYTVLNDASTNLESEGSISQKRGLKIDKIRNQNPQNDEPIPDINPNNKIYNTSSASASVCATDILPEQIRSLWNESIDRASSSNPRCKELNEPRKKAILRLSKTRFKSIGEWEAYIGIIFKSDFLMGHSSDFRASFDWILKPTNATKIEEGNYNASSQNPRSNDNTYEPPSIVTQEMLDMYNFKSGEV